jgi:hypothetical protein
LKYREECRSRSHKNGNASSPIIDPEEYVFQMYSNNGDPKHITHEMQTCFSNHLKSLGLHHVVRRKVNNSNGNNNNGNNEKGTGGRYDKSNYARSNITLHNFRKLYKTLISLHAKEADLSEYLLGHRSTLNQTYFKISPSDVAKVYLERCQKYLTFNDVAGLETDLLSVSKQNETLNQKLIDERESKDKELSELKKKMAEYEQWFDSLGEIQEQINHIKSQINEKL